MESGSRIRAIPAGPDAVLPQAGSGCIGVLMLDTRFPRWPGDIGHPASFGVPVRHVVVPGAWPASVVTSAGELRRSGLLAAFVEAARALAEQGVQAITTSCGFLVLFQPELQAAVPVPVATSSLLQLPALLERDRRVGVLTISADRLGEEHLMAAGVPRERLPDIAVQGVDPHGAFARGILGNQLWLDRNQACAEVVSAAVALREREPGLRALVLECTNMPPHAGAIRSATGLQVLSLLDEPRLRPAAGSHLRG